MCAVGGGVAYAAGMYVGGGGGAIVGGAAGGRLVLGFLVLFSEYLALPRPSGGSNCLQGSRSVSNLRLSSACLAYISHSCTLTGFRILASRRI